MCWAISIHEIKLTQGELCHDGMMKFVEMIKFLTKKEFCFELKFLNPEDRFIYSKTFSNPQKQNTSRHPFISAAARVVREWREHFLLQSKQHTHTQKAWVAKRGPVEGAWHQRSALVNDCRNSFMGNARFFQLFLQMCAVKWINSRALWASTSLHVEAHCQDMQLEPWIKSARKGEWSVN